MSSNLEMYDNVLRMISVIMGFSLSRLFLLGVKSGMTPKHAFLLNLLYNCLG